MIIFPLFCFKYVQSSLPCCSASLAMRRDIKEEEARMEATGETDSIIYCSGILIRRALSKRRIKSEESLINKITVQRFQVFESHCIEKHLLHAQTFFKEVGHNCSSKGAELFNNLFFFFQICQTKEKLIFQELEF